MHFLRTSPFFRSQRRGRWRWPWLLLGLLVSAITFAVALFAVANLFTLLLKSIDPSLAKEFLDSEEQGTTPLMFSLHLLLVGIPFWVAAMVGSLVQGRSIWSLVTPLRSFRWGLAGKTVLLVSSLMIALQMIPIPGTGHIVPFLQFTGFRVEHAVWFLPVLFFLLLQTSGEEAFFRGYLMRQLGAVTRVWWIAPAVVVAVFTSGHIGNDDMSENLGVFIPLFVVGELLVIYLLMRSGGMEIPFVLHLLNNASIFLFVAEKGTQSNDLTLWVFAEAQDEAINRARDTLALVYYLVFAALVLLAFCWRRSPFYVPPMAEQDGADQPATALEARLEDKENPQHESERRPQ